MAGYEDIRIQWISARRDHDCIVVPVNEPVDETWIEEFVALSHQRDQQAGDRDWGPVVTAADPVEGYIPPRGTVLLTIRDVTDQTDIGDLQRYLNRLVEDANQAAQDAVDKRFESDR